MGFTNGSNQSTNVSPTSLVGIFGGQDYVVLSRATYDKLVEEATVAKKAVGIKRGWENILEVEIDKYFLHQTAKGLLAIRPEYASYTLRNVEDTYNPTMTIADCPKTE